MVDPLSYFSFQLVLQDRYNKGRGMCYPVCGMVHIKEPLLLIGKSFLSSYLNGPLPYVRRHITVNKYVFLHTCVGDHRCVSKWYTTYVGDRFSEVMTQ